MIFFFTHIIPVALGTLVILASVRVAGGQSFSPYSAFQAMSLKDLETLQVQLSPQGPQDDILFPVTFTSNVNTIDVSKFAPFRRSDVMYFAEAGTTFKATPQELKAVIDNVATLPNVATGGVASSPSISFAMVNLDKGFEAVLSQADATDLFEKLRQSFPANRAAQLALGTLACPLDLFPPGTPTDVTASVPVTISGVRLVRQTGFFVATATVTNNTGAPLPTPISLVLLLANNVVLAQADGTTCKMTPIGAQFINLSNVPAAGQSTTIDLEFVNPDRLPILPTVQVLAGPGAR